MRGLTHDYTSKLPNMIKKKRGKGNESETKGPVYKDISFWK